MSLIYIVQLLCMHISVRLLVSVYSRILVYIFYHNIVFNLETVRYQTICNSAILASDPIKSVLAMINERYMSYW